MDSYRTRAARHNDAFALLRASGHGRPLALLTSLGKGPSWLFSAPLATLQLNAPAHADTLAKVDEFLVHHARHRVVGWLGYDLRDAIEMVPGRIVDADPQPLVHLSAYAECEEFQDVVAPGAGPALRLGPVRALLTRAEYEARVRRIVAAIRAGDLFQANLSQPFVAPFAGDPRELFSRLCALSPAPFAAYLEDGRGTAVLSSSPEEFVHRDGDLVRSRPIKGTRRRGRDAVEDAKLLAELLASEKDQAELAMIVDLVRNDFGKLAVPGSVAVGPFPEHASFAHVHHLFATVTARVRPGTSATELVRAVFPAGSITGAPKLRAMELIEELEARRRGVYTGAIGWFGPGPRLHLNVAIRTLVVRGGEVCFHVGGGVTARSEPAQEYEETLHKAQGMLAALGGTLEMPT